MKKTIMWQDWKWHLANAARTTDQLAKMMAKGGKNLSGEFVSQLKDYEKSFRFQVTPYMFEKFSFMQIDEGYVPDFSDPLTAVFFPNPEHLPCNNRSCYSPETENWEIPGELVVPGTNAFHWKYSDRILYRFSGCLGICSYCFETHRIIEKDPQKKPSGNDWGLGMEFVKREKRIREVILSGGDPLLASDERIEQWLKDLRSIPHIETIRIHTAALMHCPMRITPRLVEIFKKYAVTEIGIHITHPRQITSEFVAALDTFDTSGYGSVIKCAQTPLLKGINDNQITLQDLLCKLEACRIKAYYLIHDIPWTLGTSHFRTSVEKGAELLRKLSRGISHIAFPEYVIVSKGGKATVPLEKNDFWLEGGITEEIKVKTLDNSVVPLSSFAKENHRGFLRYNGTPEFIYALHGTIPVIIFRNWKGSWEMYPDA